MDIFLLLIASTISLESSEDSFLLPPLNLPFALAKITYNEDDNIYYHTSIDTYFMEESAEKYFTTERGYKWTGDEVFDDLC